MAKSVKDRFFLVHAEILPESIFKAIRAKEMLLKGEAGTVSEAVEKVRLSRSAYYKYRDRVFPLQAGITGKDITINLTLDHRTGVLSRVLSTIASLGGNILTINQEMPVQGQARVGINIDIREITGEMESLLAGIKKIEGVRTVSLQEGSSTGSGEGETHEEYKNRFPGFRNGGNGRI